MDGRTRDNVDVEPPADNPTEVPEANQDDGDAKGADPVGSSHGAPSTEAGTSFTRTFRNIREFWFYARAELEQPEPYSSAREEELRSREAKVTTEEELLYAQGQRLEKEHAEWTKRLRQAKKDVDRLEEANQLLEAKANQAEERLEASWVRLAEEPGRSTAIQERDKIICDCNDKISQLKGDLKYEARRARQYRDDFHRARDEAVLLQEGLEKANANASKHRASLEAEINKLRDAVKFREEAA